ncbi:MAG: RluA family pseudouridine synthase [bacterium]
MGYLVFTVEKEERIDKYISQKLGISRTLAQEYIRNQLVKINQVTVQRPNKIIKQGDIVQITKEFTPQIQYEQKIENVEYYQTLQIPIIYEDENLICLDKPVINVNKVGKKPSVFEYLIYKSVSPYIVHRLDRQTTGCLIVAKNYTTANKLSELFKQRKVKKKYYALVEGKLDGDLTIEAPIYHIRNPTKKQIVSYGKIAISTIRKIKIIPLSKLGNIFENRYYVTRPLRQEMTFLEVDILTGRTHQIRVHLSAIGNPVVGDVKYGSCIVIDQANTFLLHSHLIEFELDGKIYSFKSNPYWIKLVED